MSETKPKIDKGSEDGVTGKFCRRQSKSSNFICKKENLVGRWKDIKNELFELKTIYLCRVLTLVVALSPAIQDGWSQVFTFC